MQRSGEPGLHIKATSVGYPTSSYKYSRLQTTFNDFTQSICISNRTSIIICSLGIMLNILFKSPVPNFKVLVPVKLEVMSDVTLNFSSYCVNKDLLYIF